MGADRDAGRRAGDPVMGALPGGRGGAALERGRLRAAAGRGRAARARRRRRARRSATATGVWGVQFHPEVDRRGLDSWYEDGYRELDEAGVTEEQARAADARHLPGQAALSEALFGGFARVVAARTVAA